MGARSPQLSLDELLRLKWLLGGVTALVALWTVFFLDIEAIGLVSAATAFVGAAVIWPRLPGRVPAWVWKLAVPAIVVVAAVDFHASPDTLPVLIRLALLLVWYRAAAPRRKREDLQLIVLGLFLVIVAGVLTVAVEFALLLLVFTASALGFLFVINLVDAAGADVVGAAESGEAWTRLPWGRFLSRLRAVADWRLLAFGTALFTAVVLMSGLLFVLIPRFELASGFFLDRYITRQTRSGFTDTVRFGDVTELVQDNRVAMRVDLTDARGVPANPYWRLVVLDEYVPEGFRVSAQLKGMLLSSERPTQGIRGRRGLVRRSETVGGFWTIYLEPGVSRYLPLPGTFATLRLRDNARIQTTIPQERARSDRLDSLDGFNLVALRTEAMAMTAFQLDGVVMGDALPDPQYARHLRGWLRGGEDVRDQRNYFSPMLLQGPSGPANAATLERLLREITGGEKLSAAEFARRATEWLQARHAYTLSVRIPPKDGRDDIVRWLDSREPGFCEYFAAGFTVLARAAGYPARVVAGFHGGALNAFEQYYMIRNSDAHAWVEIFDGSAAWLRVDPTPGNSGDLVAGGAGEQAQDSSWSARLDSLRVLWYRRIVNFDSQQQVQMLEQVKTLASGSGATVRARLDVWAGRLKAWLARPWDFKRLTRVAGAVVGLAAAGWVIVIGVRAGWRRWRHRGRPTRYDPVRQQAGRWLGKMREYATTNAECAAVREELRRLRYGRRETWPEPRAVFRRARAARRAARR